MTEENTCHCTPAGNTDMVYIVEQATRTTAVLATEDDGSKTLLVSNDEEPNGIMSITCTHCGKKLRDNSYDTIEYQ